MAAVSLGSSASLLSGRVPAAYTARGFGERQAFLLIPDMPRPAAMNHTLLQRPVAPLPEGHRQGAGPRTKHFARRQAPQAAVKLSRRVRAAATKTEVPDEYETIEIAGITMSANPGNRPFPDLSTIKAVLFDVDGTLTNSDPLHFDAFHDILLEYGYKGFKDGAPIDREFFDEHISGGHNILLSKFLWPDRDQAFRDKFSDEKEALFRKYALDKGLPMVKGLREWIKWIDERGIKKCAVTNAPKKNAEVMLEALGLEKWFDKVVLGEECANPKPYPDPYLEGLKAFGVKSEETIVCEDSPSGTAAGVAAGVPVVGVLTSQTKERMEKAGVSLTIKDYTELVQRAKDDAAKHTNGQA